MTKHDPASESHDTAASDRLLDELLRQALEPAAGSAERIARRALAGQPREAPSRRPWLLRPAFVAIALLALAAGAALVIPSLVPHPTDHIAIQTEDEPSAEPAASPRLSISNADGTVTVTTADGTRWVALPASRARTGG